jgi:CheY-like chemotaxis protein
MKLEEATVLFVEDEPLLRESMGSWLAQHVGRAICAEHGEAALAILAAEKIYLLVTDVRMPVMDGMALVKKLHATPSMPRVILVTGFSDLSLREAYEMGVDAIVEKPIDREELLHAMRNSLADPGELWRRPTAIGAPVTTLHASFPSLAAARADKKFVIGRRGFCIKPPDWLREGPVDFRLTFASDRQVLSGRGVARWIDFREGKAGIEIIGLDEASLKWALDVIQDTAGNSCVPGCLKTPNKKHTC